MTGLKKNLQSLSRDTRMKMIDNTSVDLSVSKQCKLRGVSRSGFYHKTKEGAQADGNLELMHALDEEYLKTPFYGSRKLAKILSKRLGRRVNRKCVQRLMRMLGIHAVYSKPNTSLANKQHKKYPYL